MKKEKEMVSRVYLNSLLDRVHELEEKTSVTCGVGSGNGNLFVHGDYDSIKAVQALVFENERLRLAIGKFKNNEITKNKFDLFELVNNK